jgi:hypothetical protein
VLPPWRAVAAIGLMAAALWATDWFVHDPAMISAFRYSLSPAGYPGYGTHFRRSPTTW